MLLSCSLVFLEMRHMEMERQPESFNKLIRNQVQSIQKIWRPPFLLYDFFFIWLIIQCLTLTILFLFSSLTKTLFPNCSAWLGTQLVV